MKDCGIALQGFAPNQPREHFYGPPLISDDNTWLQFLPEVLGEVGRGGGHC